MTEAKHPHYLRDWRLHRGLSLGEMAEATNPHISKATLSRIERGNQPYTQDTLEIYARVLDVEPRMLLAPPVSAPAG